MNIVLNDTLVSADLYPFGLINTLSNIRVGILSIKERWQFITGATVFDNIEAFLQTNTIEQADIVINTNIIITQQWWQQNKSAVLLQKNITNIDDSPFIKTIKYP
jgi:Sugar nucleotidyl transferase